jgi:FtsP/CotA-like multicopper oxidase with cupredoxin domain
VNAGADIIFNLQLRAGGTAQPVQVVALDGVPIKGSEPPQASIFLPPGARAEFVVATPPPGDSMQLVTTEWDTGPEGDRDPARPLAAIVSREQIASRANATSGKKARYKSERTRPPGDDDSQVQRRLYFSQYVPNPVEGDTSVFYYITVVGQTPALYRMGQAPNIVVHQGDVEDWEVENRALEDHVFHIHQIHFQVLDVDGQAVARPEIRDTINLPHWSGSGPYPSVRLRMDFHDPNIVGTFLYHCHILKHEDMGMMGVIQVLPPGIATTTSLSTSAATIQVASPLTITAVVSGAGTTEPAGSVQFTIDGINAGAPVPLAQGRAVFTTTFDVAGEQSITATYSGDSAHDESVARGLRVKISDPN